MNLGSMSLRRSSYSVCACAHRSDLLLVGGGAQIILLGEQNDLEFFHVEVRGRAFLQVLKSVDIAGQPSALKYGLRHLHHKLVRIGKLGEGVVAGRELADAREFGPPLGARLFHRVTRLIERGRQFADLGIVGQRPVDRLRQRDNAAARLRARDDEADDENSDPDDKRGSGAAREAMVHKSGPHFSELISDHHKDKRVEEGRQDAAACSSRWARASARTRRWAGTAGAFSNRSPRSGRRAEWKHFQRHGTPKGCLRGSPSTFRLRWN